MIPAGAPLVLGRDVQPGDYATMARFPSCRIARVFFAPGEGLPQWRAPRLASLPTGIVPHVSFKDWPGDVAMAKALTAWLDGMPALPVLPELGFAALLTYLHEPENNGVPVGTYRQRYRVLMDVVRGHRRGHLVGVVPIQTLQWTVLHGDSDVFAWWAGCGDLAGIDCYADSWARTYPDPADFLTLPLRLAAGVGRRLILPELGAIRLPADKDGTRRAAWMTAVVAGLRSAGCAAVSWWDAPGTGGRDFRLSDRASADAWRAISTA